MEIRAELAGLPLVSRRVRLLGESLRDLRPFWPRLVPIFIRWMREQFESEGDWGGEQWAPLTAEYALRKAAKYPGKRILVASGDLRQAASRPRRVATARSLTLIIDDSNYRHGGDVDKAVAGFHQFGGGSSEVGEIARSSIAGRPPRRRIIPELLPVEAREEVSLVAGEYVTGLARRLGL